MKSDKRKMPSENVIIKGIENFLKELRITDEDFKTKVGGVRRAHWKITDGILKKWRETKGFGMAVVPFIPRGSTYGIDVLGKESDRGKILMSVEVDTGHLPYGSWLKLLDIRSENKIWIYLTSWEEGRAQQNFETAINEIEGLIDTRKEDKAVLGNFVVFLKTPNILRKVPIS